MRAYLIVFSPLLALWALIELRSVVRSFLRRHQHYRGIVQLARRGRWPRRGDQHPSYFVPLNNKRWEE